MFRPKCLTILLLAIAVAGCQRHTPRPTSDSNTGVGDVKILAGKWGVADVDQGNGKRPPDFAEFQKTLLIFDGGKVATCKYDGWEFSVNVQIDPAKSPKQIDLTLSNQDGMPETVSGIYKSDGETVTIAIAKPGTVRPTEFVAVQDSRRTPGDEIVTEKDVTVFTLKRLSEEDASKLGSRLPRNTVPQAPLPQQPVPREPLPPIPEAEQFGGEANPEPQSDNSYDKTHKQAAKNALKEMAMEEQLQANIDVVMDQMAKTGSIPADQKNKIRKFFTKYMGWESLEDDMVEIYMKSYSEEELNEIAAFYRTPAGKKVATKTAEITKLIMELSARKVQENQADLIQFLNDN